MAKLEQSLTFVRLKIKYSHPDQITKRIVLLQDASAIFVSYDSADSKIETTEDDIPPEILDESLYLITSLKVFKFYISVYICILKTLGCVLHNLCLDSQMLIEECSTTLNVKGEVFLHLLVD